MFLAKTTKRYWALLGLIASAISVRSLRNALTLCAALDTAAAVSSAAVPLLVSTAFTRLIPDVTPDSEPPEGVPFRGPLESASLSELCAAAIALICFSALFRNYSAKVITDLTIRARLRIRQAAFDVAAATPLDGSPIPTPGEAVSVIRLDAGASAEFLQSTFHPLVSTFIQCAATVLLVGWYRASVLPFIIAFVPIIVLSQWIWQRRVVPLFDRIRDHRLRADKAISSLVGGIRIARALGRVSSERNKWLTEEHQMAQLESRAAAANRHMLAMWDIALPAASIGVLWWSGLGPATSAADVVLVLMCLGLLLSPLQQFFQLLRNSSSALASSERLIEFMRRRTAQLLRDPFEIVSNQSVPGLCAECVEFRYVGNSSFSLGPISLSVGVGECIAIVGASGCGKSTLGWILAGILPPTSGRVSLQPPQTLASVAPSPSAVVDQEAYLFEGSIESNIRFGNPEASDAEVESAARIACLDDLLDSEVGLKTYVGHAGIGLSGGQRCRIALARALIMNPLVLVIDEFSSQLNRDLELRITKSLRDSGKNRCTIVITHSAEVVAACDRVVILADGTFTEGSTPMSVSAISKRSI